MRSRWCPRWATLRVGASVWRGEVTFVTSPRHTLARSLDLGLVMVSKSEAL